MLFNIAKYPINYYSFCIEISFANYHLGNNPSEQRSIDPRMGKSPICSKQSECPKAFHCVEGFKDSPTGKRCVTMGFVPSSKGKRFFLLCQSDPNFYYLE